jgi:hypothetical protein
VSAIEAQTASRDASVAKVVVKLEMQISRVAVVERSRDFCGRETLSGIGRRGGSDAVEG